MDADHGPDKELLSSISARLAKGEALAVAEEMLSDFTILMEVENLEKKGLGPTVRWVAKWTTLIARFDPRYFELITKIPDEAKGSAASHSCDNHPELLEVISRDSDIDLNVRKNAALALIGSGSGNGVKAARVVNLINILSDRCDGDMSGRKSDRQLDPKFALKVLRQYVSKARQSVPIEMIKIHVQKATDEYMAISEVARVSKSRITSDGELLSDERPKPPRGTNEKGMFRSASNAHVKTRIAL